MAWNLAVGPNRCDLPSQTSGISRMPLEQNTRKMEQHFNILSKMKQFRNEEKFCDAEVIVNGTTFIVHKTVLAAWSSVLASELLPVSIPNGKANIHVVYDNVEAFSDFLEFLYTGFVMVNDSNVEQLLHIGKHFNVEELVQQCENFLCSNVRLDNFVTNYFLSLRYSLSQLEEDISNFVQCNISQVIEQATFLKLTPQKFSTFIKTGKMSVAKQEIQFSLIAGWVGSEITTREKYLLSLLSSVKWINPVSDLLVQIQNTDNIFMVNEFCLFQLLHNLYAVFGDALGAFTATYSKLLNHYKVKVPDLLNLPDIVNEVDKEMLDIIPISVTGKHDSENVFNSLNVFPNENNVDKNKNNTVDNAESGLEKQVEKSPIITTIEIGVNTDGAATHVKEYKDGYSQTVLASSESSSCDTLTNLKTCESPHIDMDCQESTELQTKDSSKVSRKSKVHRRKSEPRKVVDNVKVKMKVENVGDGKIKLKTLPVVETPTRKRGRPRKSEPGRNNKHDKKKAKIKDEMVKVKQEHIDTDDNDNYNADTDDNLDLKAELELIGIQFDNTDNPDGKVIVPGDNEEKDETYKLCKDRSIKTKTYGKLKSNKKLRKPKRPYKPPSLPFKCTEEDCTYSTKTEARLEKHITSIHNTDIKLYCKKCDYVAPLMKDLCLHMKTHISGPPYRCDFEGCKFQVWRMGMLVIHQMNHLGERPYACDMCTKSFRTANQLSCHKKLHEGRKFVCDVCSKRFTTKGVMKQHRAIHFDKKEYLCDTCGFATKHQSHLISHRKIHTAGNDLAEERVRRTSSSTKSFPAVEPLARLGATVTGVDPVEKSTKVAQLHLHDNPDLVPRIKYITGTVEDLVETEAEQYDALIASEVVEHVVNLVTFVDACCRLVKPGGSILVTTINRTMMSKALAVFAAEKIARVVPVGTHDWEKFVPPEDLQYLLDKGGFTTRVVHGMFYNVLQREWCWTDNTSMNYAVHAVKSDAPTVDNTCDNVEDR